MIDLPLNDGGIKFDQYVASIHVLSVRNVNRTHDASLKWLDHLAVAGWNKPSCCARNDVYLAQAGPTKSEHKHGNERCADSSTGGGGRAFDDFERGRQKSKLLPIPCFGTCREGNDFHFRFHESYQKPSGIRLV